MNLTIYFLFRYECLYNKKKIVSKSDLDIKSEESIVDELSINCRLNGTYDNDVNEYTCTKVCPYPSNPDPEIIEISMNVTVDPKPEIYETVSYWCKDNHKLVSKLAFETAEPTNQLEELMSVCQISGWLNETIGSYTCTKHCSAPMNYSEVFDFDYNYGDATTIGSKVE